MIAVTSGEPAGIGPDICLQLAAEGRLAGCVVLGDPDVFSERAEALGLDIGIRSLPRDGADLPESEAGTLSVIPFHFPEPVMAGKVATANAQTVLDMLRFAATGCLNGRFDAMVTAPVHKGVINDAGILFSGHTEFLQQIAGVSRVVMMLASPELRVALATTHVPLADVARTLDQRRLESVIRVLEKDLRERFSLTMPVIYVAGLNPHAGEGGHLGQEEIRVIEPVLKRLRHEGMNLVGPLPADTMFSPKALKTADVFLAMYHDQGLPVLKFQSFGKAANITLGLTFIRTSVDHGTALDIAGSGASDPGSLTVAIDYARQMAAAAREFHDEQQ